MKQVLFILFFAFAAFSVNATNDEGKTNDSDNVATLILSGSVTDEISGETLVGVEVKIEGTDQKTHTDFDGNFVFKNVKAGEYKVIANYISYEKKTQTLEVSTNKNEIKIKLHSSN